MAGELLGIWSLFVLALSAYFYWTFFFYTPRREDIENLKGEIRDAVKESRFGPSIQHQNLDEILYTVNSVRRELRYLVEKVESLSEDVRKSKSRTSPRYNLGLYHQPNSADDEDFRSNKYASGSQCPWDFDRILTSCYFIPKPRMNVGYDEASEICRSKNAYLVSIETAKEFSAVREFLERKFLSDAELYTANSGWLTGAFREDGVMKWSHTNTVIDARSIFSSIGETGDGDCVEISNALSLAAVHCGKTNRHFICEMRTQ